MRWYEVNELDDDIVYNRASLIHYKTESRNGTDRKYLQPI